MTLVEKKLGTRVFYVGIVKFKIGEVLNFLCKSVVCPHEKPQQKVSRSSGVTFPYVKRENVCNGCIVLSSISSALCIFLQGFRFFVRGFEVLTQLSVYKILSFRNYCRRLIAFATCTCSAIKQHLHNIPVQWWTPSAKSHNIAILISITHIRVGHLLRRRPLLSDRHCTDIIQVTVGLMVFRARDSSIRYHRILRADYGLRRPSF